MAQSGTLWRNDVILSSAVLAVTRRLRAGCAPGPHYEEDAANTMAGRRDIYDRPFHPADRKLHCNPSSLRHRNARRHSHDTALPAEPTVQRGRSARKPAHRASLLPTHGGARWAAPYAQRVTQW